MRWSDVELGAGTITVRRALQRSRGRTDFVEPKSFQSRRTVAIPELAGEALDRHREHQREEQEAHGVLWQGANGLVFTTVDGRPLHGSTVTHQFHRLLKRSGIPRRRFHDLRHSCATVLVGLGVPPRVVMEVLGHSQISLTMNTYSHVLPEMQRQAAERMNGFLRGVSNRKPEPE